MLRTRRGWAATLVTGCAVFASGSLALAQDDQSDQDQSDRQQQRDEDARESEDRDDQERENRERENRDSDEQNRDADESRDERRRDEQARQEQDQQEQAQQQQDRDQRARDQQDERAQQDQAGERQEQQGVMLGVAVEESPTTGVLIRDVLPGSAAEQAGLRSGDYILELDGQRIGSPQQFDELLSQMQPGGRSELTIWRNEQRQQIAVNLAARQQAQFRAQQPGRQFQQGGQSDPQGQENQRQGRQRQESQAWLGVLLSEQQEERGVRVAQVYPSGPAARAGLRSGDIVLQIDDSEVSSAQELARIIEREEPDSQIELVIVRGENEEPVEVTLGSRSDYFGDAQFQQDGQFQQQGGQFQQGGQSGDFDHFSVPEHSMMLEQHRHLASQHQRIERLLYELRQEVQSLRQEIQALNGQQGQPRGAQAVPGLPQPPNDDSADRGQPAQRRTLRPGFEGEAQPGISQPVPGSAQPLPGTAQPIPRSDNRAQPNATAP